MNTIPVFQIGIGGVGHALLRQVLAANPRLGQQYGRSFEYVGVADSRAVARGDPVLSSAALHQILHAKATGGSLPDARPHGDLATVFPPRPGIVVDVSAAETGQLLVSAVAAGHHVVLANKKPLAGDLQQFGQLRAGDVRYEATVGAGLPVISTLQGLLDSGDAVLSIAGCFSGTLGAVMSAVENGSSFSRAVLDARARGWTEPDPRDDLSGMDVARKALILARTLGRSLSLTDLQVEPLFPTDHAALALDEWLAVLPTLDDAMAESMAQARLKGQTLRYMATIDQRGCSVGLKAVPITSAAGALQGPDNLIVWTTERYAEQPLIVHGPGAGVERTAAAVLFDMLAAARVITAGS